MPRPVLGLLAGALLAGCASTTADQPRPAAPSSPPPPAAAAIAIDDGRVLCTSRLELGVSLTHLGHDAKGAQPAAAARAAEALAGVARYVNVHLMGWGVDNPNPAPGVYAWDSLDARLEQARRLGGEPVLTLCTAPGWMKVGGKDWEMERRVAPEHVDDFAALCLEAVRRHPRVRHVQVWNEFKGYWNRAANDWDAEGYTALYNAVYDRIKAHDPAIRVGGFYLVVEGTGSAGIVPGAAGALAAPPLTARNRATLAYWLAHKHGADFICADRGTVSFHDKHPYTADERFALLGSWQTASEQLVAASGLPLWWSEYYSGLAKGSNAEDTACAYAEIYRRMVLGGASVALLWNPVAGECPHGLVGDVRQAEGGAPLPHHAVFTGFNRCFGAGTPIVAAQCADARVQVLASPRTLLAINLAPEPVAVVLPGGARTLPARSVVWCER
ncbi:MAG: hypothetical protein L6R48_00605 [Planctomycetes bacterium]|nr:hypothetical protein [Planctomycetota bacterium]